MRSALFRKAMEVSALLPSGFNFHIEIQAGGTYERVTFWRGAERIVIEGVAGRPATITSNTGAIFGSPRVAPLATMQVRGNA